MIDALIGALMAVVVVAFVGMIVSENRQDKGFITYEQQEQDKEQCERDIKRYEHCVPDIIWLPAASD